jgi:hypothetical protein
MTAWSAQSKWGRVIAASVLRDVEGRNRRLLVFAFCGLITTRPIPIQPRSDLRMMLTGKSTKPPKYAATNTAPMKPYCRSLAVSRFMPTCSMLPVNVREQALS